MPTPRGVGQGLVSPTRDHPRRTGGRKVLDRIDEINPPGITINPADNGWTQPALEPTLRRG
jgi:hypothetical protein